MNDSSNFDFINHLDFDFIYDEDGEETYEYYLLGDLPIRATVFNNSFILTETINIKTKSLGIDNIYITELKTSNDVKKISEVDFINQCLKFGVQPQRKD